MRNLRSWWMCFLAVLNFTAVIAGVSKEKTKTAEIARKAQNYYTKARATKINSPQACFKELQLWLTKKLKATRGLKVLDVGAGSGAKTFMLQQQFGISHQFECVDIIAAGVCSKFNGEQLMFLSSSMDILFFSFSLHHAGGHAIYLLQEAARVVSPTGYIAILEDLKADTMEMQIAEGTHSGCGPSNPCMFRDDHEWRAIFSLLRLHVVEKQTPPRGCARPIPRALYILQKDMQHDGKLTISSNTSMPNTSHSMQRAAWTKADLKKAFEKFSDSEEQELRTKDLPILLRDLGEKPEDDKVLQIVRSQTEYESLDWPEFLEFIRRYHDSFKSRP